MVFSTASAAAIASFTLSTITAAVSSASSASAFTNIRPCPPNAYLPLLISSVNTMPGDMVCTATFSPFSSSRIVFASCAMPAFVCPYAAYFFVAPPSLPAPSMLNMCPGERSSLWRFIVMIAWRVHKMDPSELVVTTSAIVAGSASSRFSYRYPLLPALLIHRSTPPKTFTTSSAKAATEDASPTFEGCPWTTAASPKRDRRSATVARTFSASRDVMKTPSPRLKNARASARPKPFVLPVMTTRCFAPAAPAAGGGGGWIFGGAGSLRRSRNAFSSGTPLPSFIPPPDFAF
mmetsp:Transcript_1589/g.5269  ORF Transcript_1589/g.5269 Transcript_1589/m.5269 type:complete len:291 (+) Transcript_1589:264-1136(+)